ncbi:M10 family metallopeptidase C-terminal domain-containing protein, partial [Phenylobacterium sp.]|uniref:M10 family metallopeptidase C-terminal domain-containing protein n=1 Tax=Phenylobacterium sp. TaxID=1871053 RepID=UPI002E30F019
QRGSEDIPSPFNITITGGELHGNALAGILVKYSHDVTINGVNIHDNGREGVKVDGSDNVSILNSTIRNNSQVGRDLYSEVYVTHSTDSTTGQVMVPEGFVITGNTISTVNGSWLIRESVQATDGLVKDNTLNGTGVDGVTRTGPQVRTETPDLTAPVGAFHYVIPQTAIADIDVGDAVSVTLQRVDSSGNLVNSGTLPSWLTFNAGNWTINGNPTTTQTIYLKLVARDGSGDTESDFFALTVRASGPYNVQSGNSSGPTPPPPPPGSGTEGNDTVTGGTGDDALNGLGGHDSIYGGTGADTMTGGSGNDVFNVDNAGDKVVETYSSGTGGVDRVEASVNVLELWDEVEQLKLLGTADLIGVGNGGANRIEGNSGNNLLDGGLGNDTLLGGAGNDTYVVNVTGDVVTEASGAGTDTVHASFSYTLGANVENLVLTGTAANGTGNSLANLLIGNASANRLTGGEGNDTLDGGDGGDALLGGAGDDIYYLGVGDTITEYSGAGTDLVYAGVTASLNNNVENLTLTGSAAINGTGNSADNVLTGNAGANNLSGTGGNDTLSGGGGADSLMGGSGADRFVFVSAADSSAVAPDLILDFKKADSDRIDLSAVDANVNADGDQAFVWATSFTGVAGQMVATFNAGTNRTTLAMDTDGDGQGDDMVILLTGNVDSTFLFTL